MTADSVQWPLSPEHIQPYPSILWITESLNLHGQTGFLSKPSLLCLSGIHRAFNNKYKYFYFPKCDIVVILKPARFFFFLHGKTTILFLSVRFVLWTTVIKTSINPYRDCLTTFDLPENGMVERALMDIRQWTFKERKNYAGIFNGL